MKVTIENIKGLNKDLKVLIDKETMNSYMDEKYEEIKGTVNLKGFRPGKVPKEVLKRQFGKAVFGEVLDKVLKETSTKALEENKIKPAGLILFSSNAFVEVSFKTLSKTSPNTALPNCLFKTSFGTFPGLNPLRFTVPLISSYFSSI
jgi:FKBP-type peptidyl-prolyl cis-trans isomerase (trigger factor)